MFLVFLNYASCTWQEQVYNYIGTSRSNMKCKSFYYVILQWISTESLWRILCNFNQVHKYVLNIMAVFFLITNQTHQLSKFILL